MQYTTISLFIFLYYLILEWSIDGAKKRLSGRYGEGNFLVSFICWRLWLLRTNDAARKVLSVSSNAKLTYINKNFIRSHGHIYGIGNLDFDKNNIDNLWHAVHYCLLKSINIEHMEFLMRKHSDIITHKYNFQYNVNDTVSEYVMVIWSKFCFGNDIDVNFYRELRNKLIRTLGKTFYDNKTNYIPFIGCLLCKLRKKIYENELKEIDSMLGKLLYENESVGFIHEFSNKIRDYIRNPILKNKISNIILDNAFLSVLVYDFLYIFLLEYIIFIATNNIKTIEERKRIKNISLESSFLFPYRMRYIDDNSDELKQGDFVIIDLIESKHYFSYGPRSCVGTNLIKKMVDIFCDIIKEYEFNRLDKSPIIRSINKNIPLIISRHDVELIIPSDKFCDLIEHFPHKGVKDFYRVESITENLNLYKYICQKIANQIIKETVDIDYLIVSESRGFLFTPVSFLTNIPVITVRKSGKIAGECWSETYNKAYDDKEILEMSVHSPIKNKQVIIIDDGIASGGTTEAIYNLITRNGGYVITVIVAIKHNYVENKFKKVDVKYIFEIK